MVNSYDNWISGYSLLYTYEKRYSDFAFQMEKSMPGYSIMLPFSVSRDISTSLKIKKKYYKFIVLYRYILYFDIWILPYVIIIV